MLRRLLAVLAVPLLLAGCRLDVAVELTLPPDAPGELAVTGTVDAAVVEQAPGLADSLAFDDAIDAGWAVEGPTPTDEGGLTIRLRHPITSAEEATNLLLSLGPPFTDVRITTAVDGDETTTQLTGSLQLPAGFESFADGELLADVGDTPFAADLTASGATPAESLAFTFRAALPGEITASTGTARDGAREWTAPTDGAALDLATTAVLRPDRGAAWAGPVSWLALAALVAWIALAAFVITRVVRRRALRSRRRDAVLARHLSD